MKTHIHFQYGLNEELLRELIAFTAVTIILWFLMDRDPDLMAYADKLVEGALIVLLLLDGWLSRHRPKPRSDSPYSDYEMVTSRS